MVEALDPDPTLVPRVPLHWESWLRGRRDDPPSDEEVERIAQRVARGKAQFSKDNEDKVEDEHRTSSDKKTPFPVYDDLEYRPFGKLKKP